MKGVVFDIKEFAVFDGPGVRTTVFMKGCPLRCQWCHNPEGLSPKRQLMVSTGSCLHCGACLAHCPKSALPEPGAAVNPVVPDCDACGACMPFCPLNLRRMAGVEWEPEALAKKLLRGEKLFAESGGGVTFSGGEPMLQWPFVRETVRALSDIPCAIETSGFCSDADFLEMANLMDFIMMDVKQADPALHKKYCGVDNAPILRHARMLAKGNAPYVLRIPMIPGVNDTEEHFTAVAELCEGAKALQKVELLPYHKTAGAKYPMLGMPYAPDFDTERPVKPLLQPFEARGIPVTIL